MERIQQLFRLLCHDYHGCQCQSDFPRSTHFVQAHAGIVRFDHIGTNSWLRGLFWSVFTFSSLSGVRCLFPILCKRQMYVFFPLQIYEHFVLQHSLTPDHPGFSVQLVRSRLLEQPHKHCSIRRHWNTLQRLFHRIPPEGLLYLWNYG